MDDARLGGGVDHAVRAAVERRDRADREDAVRAGAPSCLGPPAGIPGWSRAGCARARRARPPPGRRPHRSGPACRPRPRCRRRRCAPGCRSGRARPRPPRPPRDLGAGGQVAQRPADRHAVRLADRARGVVSVVPSPYSAGPCSRMPWTPTAHPSAARCSGERAPEPAPRPGDQRDLPRQHACPLDHDDSSLYPAGPWHVRSRGETGGSRASEGAAACPDDRGAAAREAFLERGVQAIVGPGRRFCGRRRADFDHLAAARRARDHAARGGDLLAEAVAERAAGSLEVVVRLERQPELGRGAEIDAEAQRGVRGDRRAPCR